MLTIERLKEALWLDEEEGRFYWQIEVRGKRPGWQAGSFDAYGYGQVRLDGILYKEHRLVWFYITGTWLSDQIDHENHSRRDNRFVNLRETNNHTNHLNRPMQKSNTSGFVGVHKDKRNGLYKAYVNLHGKRIDLGWHKEIESAIAARMDANQKYGFHENHGIGYGRTKPVTGAGPRPRKPKP